MYIGKLVKLEQDYVLQKDLAIITQVLYSEASHPYQYNNWCMYKHIRVFNQTTKQNEDFAILINWDHNYDTQTGKLKVHVEGLPNRDK